MVYHRSFLDPVSCCYSLLKNVNFCQTKPVLWRSGLFYGCIATCSAVREPCHQVETGSQDIAGTSPYAVSILWPSSCWPEMFIYSFCNWTYCVRWTHVGLCLKFTVVLILPVCPRQLRWIIIFTRESSYCFQRVLAIAILSVRPSVLSVCPSVTWVDQSNMVQARITKFLLSAARKTLVLGTVKLFHKFEQGHLERGR